MNRFVFMILLLGISATAAAQASRDRAGTWEVAVQLVDFSSESLGGQQGASLEVDDQLGWGAYLAYNFTNRFALGGEFIWASPDYTATRIIDGETEPDTISAEPDALDASTLAALRDRGHDIQVRERPWGNMNAVMWNRSTGELSAASDPRNPVGQGAVR